MRATESVDHRTGPVEIGLLPFQRPARRRAAGDVAQVADLVGQLDDPCMPAERPGIDDLPAFSFVLGKKLVVRHFDHDGRDVASECRDKLGLGRIRVLDRVMQDGGDQDGLVVDVRFVGEYIGESNRMIDVRSR